MIIKDLFITGFGRFREQSILFDSRMNVIYGKNESGKSTIHAFIRAMLFSGGQDNPAIHALLEQYQPREENAPFEGLMRFQADHATWRLERNFSKTNRTIELTNESTGEKAKNPEAKLSHLIHGLTDSLYMNTISLNGLNNQVDSNMAPELKEHIRDLHESGILNLDITRAATWLVARKKEYEAKLNLQALIHLESVTDNIQTLEKEITEFPSTKKRQILQKESGDLRKAIRDAERKQKALVPALDQVKETLNKLNIDSMEAIEQKKKDAQADFEKYTGRSEEEGTPAKTGPLVFFFSAAIFSVVVAAIFYFRQQFIPSGVLSGISIMLYLIGSVFLRSSKKRIITPDKEDLEKRLEDVFKQYLGTRDISEDCLKAFEKKMDDFKQLYAQYEASAKLSENLSEEVSTYHKMYNDINAALDAIQKIQWETERRQEKLQELYLEKEALETQIEENAKVYEEITAISLAFRMLEELASTIHDSFGIYLDKTASRYIEEITIGSYNAILVDDSLQISLYANDQKVDIKLLGTTVLQQVYLSLRLALADFLYEQEPLPLLLDDCLALYDDERLEAALRLLERCYSGQILLFTSHKREGRTLKSYGINYQPVAL